MQVAGGAPGCSRTTTCTIAKFWDLNMQARCQLAPVHSVSRCSDSQKLQKTRQKKCSCSRQNQKHHRARPQDTPQSSRTDRGMKKKNGLEAACLIKSYLDEDCSSGIWLVLLAAAPCKGCQGADVSQAKVVGDGHLQYKSLHTPLLASIVSCNH